MIQQPAESKLHVETGEQTQNTTVLLLLYSMPTIQYSDQIECYVTASRLTLY